MVTCPRAQPQPPTLQKDTTQQPPKAEDIGKAKKIAHATDMGLEPTTLALGGPRATIAPTGQL